MKGYVVECGYMGYVDGKQMVFAQVKGYKDLMDEKWMCKGG